jgi:putative transposase
MILTYKVRHNTDLSTELKQARQVADFALKHRTLSTSAVKHIGLKSVISNQILRKYGRNKTIKQVHSVKLTVPNQGVRTNGKEITIPCLKLSLTLDKPYQKINQIELSQEYAFVSITVSENPVIEPIQWLGIDLNATGHCAVVANETTSKVLKLGKKANHVHLKYKNSRKKLQKQGRYKQVKKIKNRESRIVRDLNHKISRRIVDEAVKQNAGIVLEDLKGIRKTKKQARSFKYSLNSWSFYQLKLFLEYKAKLQGIPVVRIDPRYTSQQCSQCGLLGERTGKKFKCSCGNVEHADVNAAFVIAQRHTGMIHLPVVEKPSSGTLISAKEATGRKLQTSRTP